MTTRTLMAVTAAFLGTLGLALLFLPLEVAPWIALGNGRENEQTLQLLGSCLFSLAALDWYGRNAIYGGIYGRPIAMGNFFVGVFLGVGMVQAQVARSASDPAVGPRTVGWIVALLFIAQSAAFFGVLFNRPWIQTDTP